MDVNAHPHLVTVERANGKSTEKLQKYHSRMENNCRYRKLTAWYFRKQD